MSLSTLLILILIGFTAGAFNGKIGIGGGIIMIPALVYLLKLDQHSAQGTSIAVMLPPIGIFCRIQLLQRRTCRYLLQPYHCISIYGRRVILAHYGC